MFRTHGSCCRVRHLRVTASLGDGLATRLAVGASPYASDVLRAALLSRWETGFAALEVGRTPCPVLLRDLSGGLRVEPGRNTERGHRQPTGHRGATTGFRPS